MNHRSGLLAALALAGLLPLAAVSAAEQPAKTDEPTKADVTPKATKVPVECESTSSRIRRHKADDCARSTQPTTNYYKDDLDRTGETDVGQALRKLDPRFH